MNTQGGLLHVTQETLGNGLVTYFVEQPPLNTIQTGPGGGQGNPFSRSDRMGTNPIVAENLTYDYLNRLKTSSLGSKSYNYDEIGNLTSKSGAGSDAYTYGQIISGCTTAPSRTPSPRSSASPATSATTPTAI